MIALQGRERSKNVAKLVPGRGRCCFWRLTTDEASHCNRLIRADKLNLAITSRMAPDLRRQSCSNIRSTAGGQLTTICKVEKYPLRR